MYHTSVVTFISCTERLGFQEAFSQLRLPKQAREEGTEKQENTYLTHALRKPCVWTYPRFVNEAFCRIFDDQFSSRLFALMDNSFKLRRYLFSILRRNTCTWTDGWHPIGHASSATHLRPIDLFKFQRGSTSAWGNSRQAWKSGIRWPRTHTPVFRSSRVARHWSMHAAHAHTAFSRHATTLNHRNTTP